MKRIFEPVLLTHHPLTWDYHMRTESRFKGYYHWHQCCELLFVHDGRGTIVVGGQTYAIRRGMLFFFQPFQLHRVHAEVSREHPYVRSIFYIDPLLAEELLRPYPRRQGLFDRLWQGRNPGQGFDLGEQAPQLERIYARYDKERSGGRGADNEELAVLLLELLNCLLAARVEPTPDGIEPRTLRHSEKIMRWIEQHYHEEVTLERLAEDTHLSKYYVSRIFRQETGSSITEYLTARRIKQVCRLLETTDRTVEQIGSLAGFESTSYFIQLFKKVVGTTPLQYRRQSRRKGNAEG